MSWKSIQSTLRIQISLHTLFSSEYKHNETRWVGASSFYVCWNVCWSVILYLHHKLCRLPVIIISWWECEYETNGQIFYVWGRLLSRTVAVKTILWFRTRVTEYCSAPTLAMVYVENPLGWLSTVSRFSQSHQLYPLNSASKQRFSSSFLATRSQCFDHFQQQGHTHIVSISPSNLCLYV
jgi:hypothetical protein